MLPFGIVGIVVGNFEVKGGNDLHHGERATAVAGAGGAERHQVVAAHQAGGLLQFFDGEIAHHRFREGVYHRHGNSLANSNSNQQSAMSQTIPGVRGQVRLAAPHY